MTPEEILRVAFGLIAVLGMIGLVAIIARKTGLLSASSPLSRQRRLALVETLALDARRRVAIIKCDDREHLVLLGPQSETLIETGLPGAPETERLSAPPANPFAELRNAFSKMGKASAPDKTSGRAA